VTSSRRIPWLRIVAESVAIVLSILLAFAIDAWWDERQEAEEEYEVLVGLEADFLDLRARLSRWEGFNRTGVRLLDQFLSDSVASLDRAAADSAFFYVLLVNVLDQGGPLEALLASGRLELIRNREIRSRLAKWPDWLEDIHTNDLSRRETAGSVREFLVVRGWPDFDLAAGCGSLLCALSGPMTSSHLRLASDPEFRARLYGRKAYLVSAAYDHGSRIPEADELLRLIRHEIDSRWPAEDGS
jgi:hypothetical protein